MINRLVKIALGSVVLGLFAACAENPFVVTQINCPAVAVVSNVGSFTRFVGEGRDASDVVYDATISGVRSECFQSEEDDSITFNVSFSIHVRKGPAFEDTPVDLPYFAALLRDNNLVTHKRIYQTRVTVPANQHSAGVRESLVQTFVSADVARRYDYELLIGFQLDSDAVIYNVLR